MFKILVAIDDSEHAQRVLDKAVQLAASMDSAELHLVHVRDAPATAESAASSTPERFAASTLPGQAVIDAAAARWRAAGATAASAKVVVGDVAPSIVARARDLGCRLIMVGTRGMGAMANLVLGSVATKVVHLSEMPVTLVH